MTNLLFTQAEFSTCDAWLACDASGILIRHSASLPKFLGVSTKKLIGFPATDLIPDYRPHSGEGSDYSEIHTNLYRRGRSWQPVLVRIKGNSENGETWFLYWSNNEQIDWNLALAWFSRLPAQLEDTSGWLTRLGESMGKFSVAIAGIAFLAGIGLGNLRGQITPNYGSTSEGETANLADPGVVEVCTNPEGCIQDLDSDADLVTQ